MKSEFLFFVKKGELMSTVISKMQSFYNGFIYPLIIFSAVIIAHTFSIELLAVIVILASVLPGLIICKDLKFIISPLILFIFAFSEKSVSSGIFFEAPYLIAIIISAICFSGCLIAHFAIHKKSVNFKAFTTSPLLFGFIFLTISFFFNGILNFDGYQYGNIIYATILTLCLVGVFILFSINLSNDIDLPRYIFYILFLTSILLTMQLFLGFINQIQITDGQIVKESVMFGWGMWNNMGGMLAFLLPIHFYFASTVKKYGFVFYFTGLVSFFAIVLTLSRSSLLVASIIIIISIVASCVVGVNKKTNTIISVIVALVGIVGIIVLWDKISEILGDYLARGFDDNGRFEMYGHGIANYIFNPIFGGGFYSSYVLEHQFISFLPFRYHNTIIQMMATCGTLGLVAYIWHRFETIKLVIKKRSVYTFFSSLAIVSMLCCSLLDNHFFNLYPTFIYSIILVSIEKHQNA